MYALGVIVVCTPIACMLEVMHVRQQVAALGIVFFACVFCNTPYYTTFMQQDAMLTFVISKKVFASWSCMRWSRIYRGGLRQRRGLPEASSKQRMLAWEMQRKHWAGDLDTLTAALYLRACSGQMAAE